MKIFQGHKLKTCMLFGFRIELVDFWNLFLSQSLLIAKGSEHVILCSNDYKNHQVT